MYVIIPSALNISTELQNLGKLPAIIYPVNQRIVFDYLYEQYGKADYRIICYEGIEEVKDRISKYDNTEIVELDKLGDLGYSVYCGLSGCEGEGYVNFADTIVMPERKRLKGESDESEYGPLNGGMNDPDIVPKSVDMFYYSEDTISSTWSFFEEKDGRIISVNDKQGGSEEERGKLFVGVFYFSHLEYLRKCLKEVLGTVTGNLQGNIPENGDETGSGNIPENGDETGSGNLRRAGHLQINSFYLALMKYSEKYPVLPVHTDDWFDIGHEDRYYSSALEVKAREFNHITIDKNRGLLRKSSDDVDKFIGEIKWYLKLPSDIEYVRPRIFDYDLSYSSPHVTMEYYAYHTVHELFLYGDLSRNQWVDIFSRIKFVCEDFKRYSLEDDSLRDSLEDMYLNKTLQRLDKLRDNKYFGSFFGNTITVNGKKYKPLDDVIEELKDLIPKMLYDVEKFNIIHGDLCFSNIMVDHNFSFIKVIDPRGKFGTYDIYGDGRYELAKLFHSVDGKYDFIIKDLFDVNLETESCNIDYKILDRQREYDLYQVFTAEFADFIGNDLKKIELIESLLFLSMIPLHGESVKHQMVMLATGLNILERVADIRV